MAACASARASDPLQANTKKGEKDGRKAKTVSYLLKCTVSYLSVPMSGSGLSISFSMACSTGASCIDFSSFRIALKQAKVKPED